MQEPSREYQGEPVVQAVPVASYAVVSFGGVPPGSAPPRFQNENAETEDFTRAHLQRAISAAFWFFLPAAIIGFAGLAAFPHENLTGLRSRVDLRVWLYVASGVAAGAVLVAIAGWLAESSLFQDGDVYLNNELGLAAVKHRDAQSTAPFVLIPRSYGIVEQYPAPTREALARYQRRSDFRSLLLLRDIVLLIWLILGIVGLIRIGHVERHLRGGGNLYNFWIALTVLLIIPCLLSNLKWEYISPVLLFENLFPAPAREFVARDRPANPAPLEQPSEVAPEPATNKRGTEEPPV